MRVVLDPNVIISALLSASGTPAHLLRAWTEGAFELVVSALLLAELERALGYPKLRERIPSEEADRVVTWLRRSATNAPDRGTDPPVRSADSHDDYLLVLAAAERAALVSGDAHLLSLEGTHPVFTPRDLLELLAQRDPNAG